ncbi:MULTISPECIES: hypothetical protein [Sphingomonas]|uniref:Uncharacterized protein n=1 Tax=Sphingomonas kyeonggiensis TaxID=1268553 RepID=A0A7W7K0U1_9SPHN|nr:MULTISPECIES: hypothetical protein [Sphingomonas]MBB4838976.1 hypothetical protein [Sphingomonas kyeonggiensis]WHU03807.1 hypothetical protein O3305_04225 [Sphingomonas sp. NIBR02145]
MRIALLALALLAGPALAQDKPAQQKPKDDSDIVVVGAKGVPPKAAKRFVRQISSSVEGQLARFAEPVCPIVAGLGPDAAKAIEARLRAVALDAGATVGEAGCRPNIALMVAHDADDFVKALHKRFPGFFGNLKMVDLRKALRDGPVHAWSTIEVRDELGNQVGGNDDGIKYVERFSASAITMGTQQVTVKSIVVIDDKAVIGKSVVQIADYLAMRTLAGARPPRDGSAVDSIITLFDQGSTFSDPELTALDQGFLQGLYKSRADVNSIKQSGEIARRIVKNSKDAGEEKKP